MGTDAFQEADIVGITMPITKHSFLVKTPEEIPGAIAAAFEIASTGRPGPVLVDITKDAQQEEAPFVWPPRYDLPGYRPVTKAHGKQIQAAAQMLSQAAKPVLYVGGGIIRARASEELKALAESSGAPVVTTLMARGAFPDSHEQHLGMPGHARRGARGARAAGGRPHRRARRAFRRQGDRQGEPVRAATPRSCTSTSIRRRSRRSARLMCRSWATSRSVLVDLDAALRGPESPEIDEWWAYLNGLRDQYPLGYTPTTDGLLAPQKIIQRIGELTGPEGIYVAGVGQHQMWAAQFIRYERPNSWLNSGGAGTMGYSVPAAMGAKVAEPDRPVWAIDGDGCFQMTNQELATCAINDIPIKVAIINNSSLGMVKQWQTLFYDGRYSNTELNTGHDSRRIPDFVKLAEAYGCLAIRVEKEDEIDAAIQKALETNDRPVVIDFVVSADAMVWPMVPQGVSNSYVQYARDHAPAFSEED